MDIIEILNLAWLVLFIATCVGVLINFLLGLTKGWRYGTYKTICLFLFGAADIIGLRFLLPVLGNLDISSINQDISAVINGTNITVPITTIYDTGTEFFAQALHALGVKASPAVLLDYGFALTTSLLYVVLLFVAGILLFTIGVFFFWLFWHILWKHVFHKKNEDGKRKKTKRIISAFEGVLNGALAFVMLVVPFSGFVNAINNNYKPDDSVANNDTIKMVNSAMQTYDDSLLAQIFFNWSTNLFGESWDTAMMSYLSQGNFGESSTDVYTFIGDIASIGTEVINSGLLGEENFENIKWSAILCSEAAPKLLYVLVDTDLVKNLLPFAVEVALSYDEVAQYLGEDTVDYLCDQSVDWTAEVTNLIDIYKHVVDSGILPLCFDDDGNFGITSTDLTAILKGQDIGGTSINLRDVVHKVLGEFEESAVLDRIISGALYTLCSKEENKKDDDPNTIQTIDMMPLNDDGTINEDKLFNISWFDELGLLFDSLFDIMEDAPEVIDAAIDMAFNQTEEGSNPIADIIPSVLAHASDVSDAICGPTDDDGNLSDLDANGKSQTGCLLDSEILQNLYPTLLQTLTNLVSSIDGVDSTKVPDYYSLLRGATDKDTLVNVKGEFASLFKIVSYFSETDAIAEFVKDQSKLPGIYFDPDGKFYGFADDVVEPLVKALKGMDDSIILSNTLPILAESLLTGPSSPLASLGLPLDLNFNVTNLGGELAEIVEMVSKCPNIIAAFGSMTGGGVSLGETIAPIFTENEEEVVRFLDAIIGSNIINPTIDGVANKNFYGLLNYLFEMIGMGDDVLDPTDPAFASMQLTNTYNADGDFNRDGSGHAIYDGETGAMVKALCTVLDSGLLDCLSGMSGGMSMSELNAFSSIDIASVFTAIGESKLISTLAATALDTYLSPMLGSGDLIVSQPTSIDYLMSNGEGKLAISATAGNLYFLYSDYGSSSQKLVATYQCDTTGSYIFEGLEASKAYALTTRVVEALDCVSFKNITDWSKEGESISKLMNVIFSGIDLSSLDFFSLSASTISDLLGGLAGSQYFLKVQSDGTLTYAFPEYIYRRMISSLDSSVLTYFADAGADLSSIADLKSKMNVTTLLHEDMCEGDLADINAWIAADGEITKIANVIGGISRLGGGGLSGLTSLSSDNVGSIIALLRSLNQSKSMGRVIMYNAIKTLSSSLGSGSAIDFSNINCSYLLSPTADRAHEIDCIEEIFYAAFDPDYGIASGGSFDFSSLTLGKISSDYLIRPLLGGLSSSVIFNSLEPGAPAGSLTAYQSTIATIVQMAGIYSVADINAPVDSVHTETPSIKEMVLSISNAEWDDEIDTICSIIDAVKGSSFVDASGNFTMSSLNDLATFFAGSDAAIESKRAEVSGILSKMNSSKLFYRAIPEKINAAIGSVGLAGDLADDIKKADAYCMATSSTSDFAPYRDDSTYSELDKLTYCMVDIARLSAMDLSDISSIQVAPLADALVNMATSGIFNSVQDANGDTAFRLVARDILAFDTLSAYYFNASNPKDAAAVSGGLYNSAATKALYNARALFPAIVSHEFLSGNEAWNTALDAQALLLSNGVDSDASTFIGFIKTLLTPEISSKIGATLDFASFGASELDTLLVALNQNIFYRDCLPNALDSFLSSSSISIIDIDVSKANPYFQYYLVGDEVNLDAAPNWDAAYPEEELHLISHLADVLMNNSASFNETDPAKMDTNLIRETLSSLYNSYLFHAGETKGGEAVDYATRSSIEYRRDNLTVFEQMIYKIYDASGLAENAFSSYYDFEAYADSSYSLSSDAYKLKLKDRIIGFSADDGATVKSQDGLHSGDWDVELRMILGDGRIHIGDDADPIVGLIPTLKSLGLDSSSLGSSSLMSNLNPTNVKLLFNSINKLDVVNDALPYLFKQMVTTDGGSSGLSLQTYGLDSIVDTYASPVASWGSSLLRLGTEKIAVTASSTPTLYVGYASDSSGANAALSITPTVDGSVYTYDVSSIPGYCFRVEASSISKVVYSFNTPKYDLEQSSFLAVSEGGNGDIDHIVSLLDGLYDDVSGTYFDFSSSDIQDFIATASAEKVSKILDYFIETSYYNSETFEFTYMSRDVNLANLFTYTDDSTGVPVTVSLSRHIGGHSIDDHSRYAVIESIVSDSSYDSINDARWLLNNSSNAGYFEATIKTLEDNPSYYQASLAALASAKLDVVEDLFSSLNDPLGVSPMGRHIVAGDLQDLLSLGYTYISSTRPTYSTLSGGTINPTTAHPDYYGVIDTYSMDIDGLATFENLEDTSSGNGLLSVEINFLRAYNKFVTSSADLAGLKANIEGMEGRNAAITKVSHQNYVDALYTAMLAKGYYSYSAVGFVDFPDPLEEGCVASFTPNTAFSFSNVASCVA